MKHTLAHALWITLAFTACHTSAKAPEGRAANTPGTPSIGPEQNEAFPVDLSPEPIREEKSDTAVVTMDAEDPSGPTTTATTATTAPKDDAKPTEARQPSAPPPPQVVVDSLGQGSGATTGGAVGRATRGKMAASPSKRMLSPSVSMAQPPHRSPLHHGRDGEGGEDYKNYGVNEWTDPTADRLSTFAVDVDTASYAIARRKIHDGTLPPAAAVRVEEFVNYFNYGYAGPTDGKPFAVYLDAAPSPFTKGHHIFRVGLASKRLSISERKSANLVFLVDVSGSMNSADKLELGKRALRILVDNLKDGDYVSLVTYAGNTRVVLEPTGLEHKGRIVTAIEDLTAGGSTAMSSGIELAYELAAKNLGPNTISRVIVLSDGDANVGNTSHDAILKTIAGKVKEGVTLSTIGLGMGNYKDQMMEQLANKGNGNYFYIDSLSEAKRVFQEQTGSTLEVVAKDVKIQVDFDPAVVKQYRLIGYENRDIADVNFRNDKVDAGEIGAGHTVTAIYELELTDPKASFATVRVRHKAPRGTKAEENAYAFRTSSMAASFQAASSDFRFATAVMATAELLRRSKAATGWRLDQVAAIARGASDNSAERRELIDLLSRIANLRETLIAR